MKLEIKVVTRSLFLAKMKAALLGDWSEPEFTDMRRQWSSKYEAFIQRRWSLYARGGGDWPPLALSTIRARRGPDKRRARQRKKGLGDRNSLARDTKRGTVVGTTRAVSILIDTGSLKKAATVGATGNVNEPISKGIKFGFGGVQHTSKKAKGRVPTFAQIARWHNNGEGNNPKRLILAAPDADTVTGMQADLKRQTGRLYNRLKKGEPLK
jgi:hypothetical protein